LDKMQTTW